MDIILQLNAFDQNSKLFKILRANNFTPVAANTGYKISVTLQQLPLIYKILTENGLK